MRTVLIANRGEIAVRIIRACRERGLRSVAVHSDVDADALHVQLADTAVAIGPAPSADSYLSVSRIVDAARAAGADAVHPGYGFLSERPELADACIDAGLTFIGPPPTAIRQMGSKAEARRLMEAAGVPCVPGMRPAAQTPDAFEAAARTIGYPLLVKASAGGGGKGMRRVAGPAALHEAVAAARREAVAAFGDGTLLVERCLDAARHIELQIAADAFGRCVHLGERECSLQRRHQKVVEEAPSPVMTPDLRSRMGQAAVAAAMAVGYRNVGTVEFLVTGGATPDAFYFLEMNTRLQVEHPVTEAVIGLDLVHLQFDIAEGRPLPWAQDALAPRGHAIECRIYAEAPEDDFLPQAGRVLVYREPQGPGIRVDAGIREGADVSPYYDPLLAKLVVWAETRERALDRARAALRDFVVLGIRTNIGYLQRVLDHPDVQTARVHTTWLEQRAADLTPTPSRHTAAAHAVAAALRRRGVSSPATTPASHPDPWSTVGAWRG
jgi:acetyl-CoA/propionyl-CoA carboxylase biotin carboxyl carrier protein